MGLNILLNPTETFISRRNSFVTLPMGYGKSTFSSKNNETLI